MAPTTPVLAHAQAKNRERFRSAYGCSRSAAEPPCRPSSTKSSASRTDSYVSQEFPVIVTTGAGRRRGDLLDSSLARTDAQSRAELESSRAGVPC